MLGAIVSNRCAIIAASLLVILVALAGLVVIDLLEILTLSSQQYDVGQYESRIASDQSNGANETGAPKHQTEQEGSLPRSRLTLDQMDLVDELNNRLRSGERLRETPLLASNRPNEDEDQPQPRLDDQSPILTRANYLYNARTRPQSPYLFKVDSPETPSTAAPSPTQSTTKGVLKKAGSFQRVYPSEDESDSDENGLRDYQSRQTKRDLQNRRALLNVRFAD